MLELRNVTFGYGRREAEIFRNFSLQLAPNGIYGLFGKNGTGKSTLLYLMSGLLRPQQGQVDVDGLCPQERRPELLREIFLVPEEFELPDVSLERYVSLNEGFYPHFSREVLAGCLADFELPGTLRLGQLSMGQKKKAYMSFALAAGTRILLMDEPTNGLDIPSKSQFRKVISRHMAEDRILVISTHQVRDVEMLIDHVVMLDGTRLLLNRPTADIAAALCFEERPAGMETGDALYVQPSVHGNNIVRANRGGEDTPIDLELLFNALLQNPCLLENRDGRERNNNN